MGMTANKATTLLHWHTRRLRLMCFIPLNITGLRSIIGMIIRKTYSIINACKSDITKLV